MRTQKLDAMLSGMMDCLKENGCAISYLSKIEMECHQFKRYAEKLGTTHFYPALCKRYLSAKYGDCCSDREKRTSHHELTIRLMEWLKEYAESGAVCMAQQSSRVYVIPDYEDILQSYLYCQEQNGLKPKTISHKRHCLLLLFEYLETIGVTSVEKVNASHFYGYLESKHCLSVTTKEAILYVLRDFIRYLTDRNLCNPKLSGLFSVISTHGKIAVAASITSPAAKLRKSSSLSEPAAVQFRSLIVRSVSGRYRECGAGKRQHPVTAGNPVPASKAGSHRYRQSERAGVLFQWGERQHRNMGSGKLII
jgi:hypothetical protein